MTLEEAYKKNQKLIWKLAWSWNKTTGQDIEELHSEALLAFCEAFDRWDEGRGKLTTFITFVVNNQLSNYCLKLKRQEKRELIPERGFAPDRYSALTKMISSLRKEAKEVVLTILNSPGEIFEEGRSTPTKMKREVKEYLVKKFGDWKGEWIKNQIVQAIKEM